jgi:DNA processing protein
MAVPGNITSPNSFGPNLWIKQGAKLIQNWEDIVEELPRSIKEQVLTFKEVLPEHRTGSLFPEVLTASEKCVLELLRDDQASHVDHLLERSGLASPELLATLSELEMKDKIKQLPGKNFVKKV